MIRLTTTLVATAATLATFVATPQESGAQEVEIQEWEVPYENSRPRDPAVAPDGRVWFVGQRADYAAVLDPSTGEFQRFDLPEGAGPHNLIVMDDGTVFYAGNRAAHIGKMDPETGAIEQIPMPNGEPRDPHTLIQGRDGDIWFTAQGGNKVGHLVPATGELMLVDAPMAPGRGGEMGSSRPYGIKVDSQNRAWIALLGTNLIGMVAPGASEMETFELPEGARPRRLVVDSQDKVWYVDWARGKLAKLDPETGDVREWDSPGGEDAGAYGMAIDASDRIWYVETGVDPNTFVGFDPATEAFTVTPIPSGAGAVRHMYYDENTNSVWFGTDANTIGQATLPPLRGQRISAR